MIKSKRKKKSSSRINLIIDFGRILVTILLFSQIKSSQFRIIAIEVLGHLKIGIFIILICFDMIQIIVKFLRFQNKV